MMFVPADVGITSSKAAPPRTSPRAMSRPVGCDGVHGRHRLSKSLHCPNLGKHNCPPGSRQRCIFSGGPRASTSASANSLLRTQRLHLLTGKIARQHLLPTDDPAHRPPAKESCRGRHIPMVGLSSGSRELPADIGRLALGSSGPFYIEPAST